MLDLIMNKILNFWPGSVKIKYTDCYNISPRAWSGVWPDNIFLYYKILIYNSFQQEVNINNDKSKLEIKPKIQLDNLILKPKNNILLKPSRRNNNSTIKVPARKTLPAYLAIKINKHNRNKDPKSITKDCQNIFSPENKPHLAIKIEYTTLKINNLIDKKYTTSLPNITEPVLKLFRKRMSTLKSNHKYKQTAKECLKILN